jgi:TonB family protein
VAAEAKVKELQERLAALEAEKAAAEAKAAEDAKKKIEAQAAARGQAVDPAALARAQEEARRKAQADQERLAQEEKKRLETEKAAEEARVAEEKRKAEEDARVAAAAATTTLPEVTTPASPAAPTTKPGTLVTPADAGVIAPVLERRGALQYPPLALRQRVEGVVELNVLVDEKGGVSDVQVVTGAGGRSGLNEAAIDYARRQRYRPATKDGVTVKVWMPLRVKFDLPK